MFDRREKQESSSKSVDVSKCKVNGASAYRALLSLLITVPSITYVSLKAAFNDSVMLVRDLNISKGWAN